MTSEWKSDEHVAAYLERADTFPERSAGEAVLLDEVPLMVRRVLDLGAGNGRLLNLVLANRPGARGVALDFSPPMLEQARARFASRPDVEIVEHDLEHPLPAVGL